MRVSTFFTYNIFLPFDADSGAATRPILAWTESSVCIDAIVFAGAAVRLSYGTGDYQTCPAPTGAARPYETTRSWHIVVPPSALSWIHVRNSAGTPVSTKKRHVQLGS